MIDDPYAHPLYQAELTLEPVVTRITIEVLAGHLLLPEAKYESLRPRLR